MSSPRKASPPTPSRARRSPRALDGPTPAPTPELTAAVGFAAPPPRSPSDPPLEQETTTAGEPPTTARLDDQVSGSDFGGGELPPRSEEPRSSTRVSTSDVATYATAAGIAFSTVGAVLHARLAAGSDGIFMPEQEDVEAVCTPLGRIAARHSPLKGGEATDLSDGIEAMVGVAGYGIKNVSRLAEFRRWKAARATGLGEAEVVDGEQGA